MSNVTNDKTECPPCPKYNFKESEEAILIKEQTIKKNNSEIESIYKKMPDISKFPPIFKILINKLINSNYKSYIDDINFEGLINNDKFLQIFDKVIDQEMIDNIIDKGSIEQIRLLSELECLNNDFKVKLKEKLKSNKKYLKYKKKYLNLKYNQ